MRVWTVILGAVAFALSHAPALAEKRVALVIGNSQYQNISPLNNPTNDAALISETLASLGFLLVGGKAHLNLDKAGLDSAVQSFGNEIANADVAIFYYAGHGLQVRGANYLVPINANPTKEADVDFQMLDINLVLRQMEGAGSKLNLVVLDACRNNPLASRGIRSANSGLAQMHAPEGTLISFATQPGNVALDGQDGNSPYSKALARAMKQPGIDVFRTFNQVGLEVKRATDNAQQPWMSNSPISGDFYFAGLGSPRIKQVEKEVRPRFGGKRLALMIGNNSYPKLPTDQQLTKAINDANLIGATLKKMGFKVSHALDLDRRSLIQATDEFVKQIGQGDMALIYFAGHGLTLSGGNYLAPKDIKVGDDETIVKRDLVSEAEILAKIENAKPEISIMILDAGRYNPFQTSSSGVQQLPAYRDTFLIYSSTAGGVCYDSLDSTDTSPNSVFTRVMAEEIQRDVPLSEIMASVRKKVSTLTKHLGAQQLPVYFDQTHGASVYLADSR